MEEKEFDYINVIPLVDVMLVLLTIVLTTSTFIASGGIPVNLPQASQQQPENLRVQVIEIDQRGDIYFNVQRQTLRGLQDALRALNKTLPVLIRADRRIPLQGFVEVLDVVKNLGFHKVSIQTETKR